MTLDEVSARIDQICEDHVAVALRSQVEFNDKVDALAADVAASLELNQHAVGSIVIGRVNQMVKDLAKAVG